MMMYMIITIWTILQYFESDTNQALNSRESADGCHDGCHVKYQHEYFDLNKVKRSI